jgi:hypothetical protein
MSVPHQIIEDFLDSSDQVTIEVACTCCNQTKTLQVSKRGYDRWVKGELIQNAIPEVPFNDREILISQTCSDCFDRLFAEDE